MYSRSNHSDACSIILQKFLSSNIIIICTNFQGFDLSVMLQRNAFLVDLVSDKRGGVLKLDSINIASTWKGMDTLIFNTWHWWLLTGRQQPYDHLPFLLLTVSYFYIIKQVIRTLNILLQINILFIMIMRNYYI